MESLCLSPLNIVQRRSAGLCQLGIGTRPLATVLDLWGTDEGLERQKTEVGIGIRGAVLEDTYNRVDVGTLKLAFCFTMANNGTCGVV